MEIASFADATLKNDSSVLLAGMGELLEERAKTRGVPTIQYSNVT
jgi:hypothetical protein